MPSWKTVHFVEKRKAKERPVVANHVWFDRLGQRLRMETYYQGASRPRVLVRSPGGTTMSWPDGRIRHDLHVHGPVDLLLDPSLLSASFDLESEVATTRFGRRMLTLSGRLAAEISATRGLESLAGADRLLIVLDPQAGLLVELRATRPGEEILRSLVDEIQYDVDLSNVRLGA
jgi:hypothetical protein